MERNGNLPAEKGPGMAGAQQRAHYLDRIRVVLTALVVLHHTAITYGAPGGWFYRELETTVSLTGLFFILFVSVNQAYFMGFFFLLAGYFTPASCERKGPYRFAVDRLIRLGIPLAVFAVVLDPLTNAIAEVHQKPLIDGFVHRVANGDWHNGPLWFAQALLLFSAAYLVWTLWRGHAVREPESPLPSSAAWPLSALGVGAVALLIRQWVPVGRNVFGLQLGYFSSYIFLFLLGTITWQRNWLVRVNWKVARRWTLLSMVLLPVMVLTAVASGAFTGKPVEITGGLSIPAIVYAFWEPFVAWGIIAGLLCWFQTHANQPSARWDSLASTAYAVYILHAPVLVGISVCLRSWQAPALVKFTITGSMALVATWALSWLLLRIPGVRRVV